MKMVMPYSQAWWIFWDTRAYACFGIVVASGIAVAIMLPDVNGMDLGLILGLVSLVTGNMVGETHWTQDKLLRLVTFLQSIILPGRPRWLTLRLCEAKCELLHRLTNLPVRCYQHAHL